MHLCILSIRIQTWMVPCPAFQLKLGTVLYVVKNLIISYDDKFQNCSGRSLCKCSSTMKIFRLPRHRFVRVAISFSFLFDLLPFIFCPLCCLSIYDLLLLVSSNFSCIYSSRYIPFKHLYRLFSVYPI